jgi:hypothetical protein
VYRANVRTLRALSMPLFLGSGVRLECNDLWFAVLDGVGNVQLSRRGPCSRVALRALLEGSEEARRKRHIFTCA